MGADPNPLVDWGVFPEKDEDCFDYDIATWAVKQLRAPPKGPWVLAVGFQHPHVPCYAPKKWFDLYPPDKLVLPKYCPRCRKHTEHKETK